MFQAGATSQRLDLPSSHPGGHRRLGRLDETTIQGCCKPCFRRKSGNPLCGFLIEGVVLCCASDCSVWQMRAALGACDRLFYCCRGRVGRRGDVFGPNPASSLVPVDRGFVGRFPIWKNRLILNEGSCSKPVLHLHRLADPPYSPYQDGHPPLGTLDETAMQGRCKSFFLC